MSRPFWAISEFREWIRPTLPYLDRALDDLHCPHDLRGEALLDNILVGLYEGLVRGDTEEAACGCIAMSLDNHSSEGWLIEISVTRTLAWASSFKEDGDRVSFKLYPRETEGQLSFDVL